MAITRINKSLLTFVASAVLAASQALAAGTVGQAAPDFTLKGIDGKSYSLSAYRGKVVVLEWINPNCPFSARQAKDGIMTGLVKKHGDVVWLSINSTNPEHGNSLTPADHLAWNKQYGIQYPVLLDPTGKVGHSYDAKTTPHMFIIDPQGKIAYNGAIDDDPPGRKDKASRLNYVNAGLVAEKGRKNPDPATTNPYGCSIKY
jgi:peroxiredoxin